MQVCDHGLVINGFTKMIHIGVGVGKFTVMLQLIEEDLLEFTYDKEVRYGLEVLIR